MGNASDVRHMLNRSVYSWGGCHIYNHKQIHIQKFRIHANLDVSSAIDVINDLGMDTLTFLAVTVIIVPAFKIIKASPVSFTSHFCFIIIEL